MFSIKDENGKWFDSSSYRKYVKFSNEYGTKDELLKKGYVENETIFYYPSNGEKDWRVGEWTNSNNGAKLNFDGMKEINKGVSILATKKSYVIRFNDYFENNTFDKVSFQKKDYLIIDLLNAPGGWVNPTFAFAEKIKKSK